MCGEYNKGLLKQGGSARREAIGKLLESVGGRLESLYFAFGADDFIIIGELPDNVSASAVALNAAASGAVSNVRTTVLLTPEEVDQVAKKSVVYKPPTT
ncbi:MAG TPA: GYD domain-containing protein [Candidatus Eremiobacteraceae bacterium]|nr:GYD domain-containing protein [Candidatus Eremiobacteraceae bacterium]